MKIAFLSFYSGELYRGVETFVHELANRLVEQGNEVFVYQNGQKLTNSKYKTISIGISFDVSRKNSYIPYFSYFPLKVKKFTSEVLRRLDKDVDVVFPTNGQWQSLLCRIWCLKYRKKLVISGQSGPGIDDRLNLITFPNAFVSLTSFQKDWAKKANPLVRVEKIPNGVDLAKFSPKTKGISLDLSRPIILCVAAFDFWKRLDLIIKAVGRLQRGSLFLVGKGREEAKLRALGNKFLPGRFKISSFPHHEMSKVYAACDLFTYATVPWESFGIVIAEAMATNLPVVATNDPIRREIVGRAGVLVDPTNTTAYSIALENALKLRWGRRPVNQARKFDWDIIAARYQKLFSDLVK